MSARTVAQLTTGTLSLVAQSLGNLNENTAPMAVGLRPQSPPVITLGTNTFTTDASGNSVVADPLLTLSFPRMELDFFATVDHQYVRAFTVVADVTLPLGMQTTAAGQLAPVLGDVAAAFTNLSVKNSEAVTESPEQIAAVLPSLLQVVVPSLTGALGSFALPSFGGLALDVKAITSVPQLVGGTDHSYLALYADLVPAPLARPVTTTARVVSTRLPEPAAAADPRLWRGAVPPAVTLALGGANVPAGAALEWSYRLDEGLWSAWSPSPTQTVTGAGLWLAVDHVVEVRARERGVPASMDPLPVRVAFAIPTAELALARAGGVRPFHGAPVPGGCACDAGGRPGASPLLALLLGLLVVGRKRLRRVRARLGTLMTALVIALVPGCSCGSDAASTCGDTACKPGDVAHGGFGRFTSIAADGSRVLVATYDQDLGDLVVVDATDPAAPHPVAVDGLPPGVTPTHDPKGYRGGIEGAGPNVGAWTAIGIQDGLARVAYQDRDAFALKYAVESAPGVWTSYVVDEDGASDGVEIGAYASLAFDSNGHAAIAYVAEHVTSATGQLVTELRLARAASRSPGANDWTTTVITSGAGTCADRCGTGTACVTGTAGESCAAVTTDCTVACAAADVCIAGTCTKPIADPMLETIGSGPGLFASLVVLPDGRLAVAFYDMPGHALALAVESAAASSTFTLTPLDAPATGDRGLFASAAVDAAGVVHVAYQDAITDELLYTTYSSATAAVGTPEVVDDGVRAGDRTHPVGAGASIYLTAGGPAIAYQDGLTADVDVATRTGSTWTHAAVAATPLLDGFHIATTTAHGAPYLAWDQLDPAKSPPNTLHVETQ